MASWAWALEFQPTDKDGGSNPPAVPIGDVMGAAISYGKRGDALSYSGGTCVLQLDNTTSAYTPDAGGTYANAQFLGTKVRIYADVTGAGAPSWTHGPPAAFTGVVTDIEYSFQGTFESSVRVTVSDALTMLGTLSFGTVTAAGFTLDSAIRGLLDTSRVGFDFTDGLDVDAGLAADHISRVLAASNAVTTQIEQTEVVNPSGDAGQTLQAVTDYKGTAGSLLQTVEHSDGGDVYVRHGLPIDGTTPNNAVTFRTRGQKPVTSAVTSVVGLTPLNLWDARLTPSGTEPHYYSSIDFASGTKSSYSQVSFTSTGGTEQTATANVDQFGARSISRTGLLCENDTATKQLADAFLAQYGTENAPPLAVRDIVLQTIVEGENDDYQLVKTSVGDSTTVRLRPEGASSTLDFTGVISGVRWNITPTGSQMTVQLEDGAQTVFFLLDDAGYGLLDVNQIG